MSNVMEISNREENFLKKKTVIVGGILLNELNNTDFE